MSGYSVESSFHERQLMKDPTTASSRIFVGSIPHENVTRKDIEDVFSRFGKVTGVSLNKGFGFVQFEEDGQANSAINSQEVFFRGRRLDVKQARVFRGEKPRDFREERPERDTYWEERERERTRERERVPERAPERDLRTERENYRDRSPIDERRGEERDWRGRERERYEQPFPKSSFYDTSRERFPRETEYRERYTADPGSYKDYPDPRSLPIQEPTMKRTNDCEIIALNKKQTRYAEFVESRLKQIGLTVDILFPNEDVKMGRVLANISNQGSLYAIIIEPSNEEHRSLTINILHGVPEAHRNMPFDDAITLIGRNFEAYQRRVEPPAVPRPSAVQTTPVLPTSASTGLNQDRHPDAIQALIKLLYENRPLTTLQYDKLMEYLRARREIQIQIELGEASEPQIPATLSASAPVPAPPVAPQKITAELQSRILSILSSKSAPKPQPSLSMPSGMTSQSSTVTVQSQSSLPVNSPMVNPSWNSTQPTPSQPPASTAPILNDPNVQKMLDSLMQGNMLQRLVSNVSANQTLPNSNNQPSYSSAPSQPLFSAYPNSSNHVGGRRF